MHRPALSALADLLAQRSDALYRSVLMIIGSSDARRVLKEDKRKIEESILYLLKRREGLTQFQIGKALYFADMEHLNRFGRPVTFDNYTAMQKGPVPSLAYDALKPEKDYSQLMGSDRPWTSIPRGSNPDANEFTANRLPRLEYLSKTDLEALDLGLDKVLNTPREELHRLTHDNPAYKEAWSSKAPGQKGKFMRLDLMIERDGDQLADDLAYISRN